MAYNYDSLISITTRPDLVFVEGRGSRIRDHNGKEYLDCIQGWAVNSLGHGHPAVLRALAEQAVKLINPSPAFYNEPMLRLADMLVANSCFDQVFFANCGAEANEGALKLARKWGQLQRGGAYEIVTFDHAFHGRTLAMMSASGKAAWEQLYEPKVKGFPKAELNDLASVEAALTDRTVGVMLEPLQGEAGVYPATLEFLRELRRLTTERGILLIVDEVQTGMGRTGRLFAYEHADIEPDIMTLGKGIGSGVPLAALLAKREFCCFEPGDQGGTFNGSPLMTAVGCAVLETMLEPDFLPTVCSTSAHLRRRLEELKDRHGLTEVRGEGLLMALSFPADTAAAVAQGAMEAGLLINAPQPDTLRFMPALTITPAEIDDMVTILDRVIGSLAC